MAINITGALLYQEGTWTPVVAGATTPGTQTYAAQAGYYTRIGNRVTADFRVQLSALDGAAAGNLSITGLPFPALTDANMIWTGTVGFLPNTTHTASLIQFGLRVASGTSTILVQDFGTTTSNAAGALVTMALCTNTTTIIGNVTYRAA